MNKIAAFLIALCLLFSACGDGGQPTVTSSDSATATVTSSDTDTRTVVSSDVVTCPAISPVLRMKGDSITHQAGQTIKEFLPCWTVINEGVDGTMVRDLGTPIFRTGEKNSISFGTNECLNDVSVLDYTLALNHVLWTGIGYDLVLEAPWRVVDPRCSPYIDYYIAAVIALGLIYFVPVVQLDKNQDHIGEGIHLTQEHMRTRAQLLANAVKKL
jgi:hypothetical protein